MEQGQFEILLLETRALYPHRSLDILWIFHDVPSRLRNEKIVPESIFVMNQMSTKDKLSLMITYIQMNSLTVQKVYTSTTKGPNENQSRTFLLSIYGILATKIAK